MTMNPSARPSAEGRPRAALVMLALMVLPGMLAPSASAYHATRPDEIEADTSGLTNPSEVGYGDVRPLVRGGVPRTGYSVVDGLVPTSTGTPVDGAVGAGDEFANQSWFSARQRVSQMEDAAGTDAVRDALMERQRQAVEALNRTLSGLPGPGAVEALPAPVIRDGFEPGSRVGGWGEWRVLGGGWHLGTQPGDPDSTWWSASDPETGRYTKMDALLLSPAIDLGAYPVACGTTPYCAAHAARGPDFTQPMGADQITLLLEHAWNFAKNVDGGQVLVFTRDPHLHPTAPSQLLFPQDGSQYTRANNLGAGMWAPSLPRRPDTNAMDVGTHSRAVGFTGFGEPQLTGFDLTPWGGKTVWIGFRAVGGSGASASPAYFAPPTFAAGEPFGWFLDKVEILAAAYPTNVRVLAFEGPTFRLQPTDPLPVVAEREGARVSGVILNAGAFSREVAAVFEAVGTDGTREVSTFQRRLQPGEVWVQNWTTPGARSGANVTVRLSASPVLGSGDLPDPTADHDWERVYRVATVRRAEVSITVPDEDRILNTGDSASVTALVRNAGNRALVATLEITRANSTEPPLHVVDVALAAGETVPSTFVLAAGPPGRHVYNTTLLVPDLPPVRGNFSLYTRVAPSIIYEASRPEDRVGWTVQTSGKLPKPEVGDRAWMARPPQGATAMLSSFAQAMAVLKARPESDSPTLFGELRLDVVYFGAAADSAYVQIMPGGLTPSNGAATDAGAQLSVRLPSVKLDGLAAEPSWHRLSVPIYPEEALGYDSTVLSLGGTELRVVVFVGTSQTFLLDDLRLSGVPMNGHRPGEEWQRVDLLRITGDEDVAGADPTAPATGAGTDVFSPCLDGPERVACWVQVASSAFPTPPPRWGTTDAEGAPVALNGTEALFGFRDFRDGITTGDEVQRLVSPPIRLKDVIDPTVQFRHEYYTSSFPSDDDHHHKYTVGRVLFVETQYKRDDGTWSPWHRLTPDEGYPHPLRFSPFGGDERIPVGSRFRSNDGFYHPPPCPFKGGFTDDDECQDGGWINNRNPDTRNTMWAEIESPAWGTAELRLRSNSGLEGVDLEGREIRLGFHVSRRLAFMKDWWVLGNVTVAAVSRPAVDVAVESVDVRVPYDWRTIGVGPGTAVPIEVTVRNAGLFTEAFGIRVIYRPADGSDATEANLPVGPLSAGSARTSTILWQVPTGERVGYQIEVVAHPLDSRLRDEFPGNDRRVFGADGSLVAVSSPDLEVASSVFPTRGRDSLPRQLTVALRNSGNVPLEGVVVEQTIARLEGVTPSPVTQTTWTVPTALLPSLEPVNLRDLADPPMTAEESFIIPGRPGQYSSVVTAKASVEETDTSDNMARARYSAGSAAMFEDFEEPSAQWNLSPPGVWGFGDGFGGTTGLVAGLERPPPSTDASAMSPPLPLGLAKNAHLQMVTKYDLEHGYDGARVEFSRDGKEWLPLRPAMPNGRPAEYPDEVVGSNALSGSGLPTRALTGDSAQRADSLDGWVPLSYNLAHAPGMSEEVFIEGLFLPKADPDQPISRVREGRHLAPWMILDPEDPEARWEIQDLTEGTRAPGGGSFWWSGRAPEALGQYYRDNGFGGTARTLLWDLRTLSTTVAAEEWTPLMGEDGWLELSWWDWRSGARNSSWRGTGTDYSIRVEAVSPAGESRLLVERWDSARVEETSGDWSRIRLPIAAPKSDEDLRVDFTFGWDAGVLALDRPLQQKGVTTASARGWALADMQLKGVGTTHGVPSELGQIPLMGAAVDNRWNSIGPVAEALPEAQWRLVEALPAEPFKWVGTTARIQSDEDHPAMKVSFEQGFRRNVDTRLVSPTVDLTALAGTTARLRLYHAFDLLSRDVGGDKFRHWEGIHRQAAAVEVQVFDDATATWGPWRQLFASDGPPASAPAPRPQEGTMPPEGTPYTTTLFDEGDSFERFQRIHVFRHFQYDRLMTGGTSYAFSGSSGGPDGIMSEFDLEPYVGQKVRLGFHAWSGAAPYSTERDPLPRPVGAERGPMNLDRVMDGGDLGASRHWTIGRVELLGQVLNAPTGYVRLRMGTDATNLDGSWQLDGFELMIDPYRKSVGIAFEDTPRFLSDLEPAIIRGTIRNYGPQERELVAIGLDASKGAAPRSVEVHESFSLDVAKYDAVAGPFRLGPAGSDTSVQPFAFKVMPANAGATHVFHFQLLEGVVSGGGLEFVPPYDDVPGRARRTLSVEVSNFVRPVIDGVRVEPGHLSGPGRVNVTLDVRNTGTVEAEAVPSVRIVLNGTGDAIEVTGPRIPIAHAGRVSIPLPSVDLAEEGNYSVSAALAVTGVPDPVTFIAPVLRINRSDVALSAGFEEPELAWQASSGFRIESDDVASGSYAVLFGANATEYYAGGTGGPTFGALFSPRVDLRTAGPDVFLAFWHKAQLDQGDTVEVLARRVDCSGEGHGPLRDPIQGQILQWTYERIALDSVRFGACNGVPTDTGLRGHVLEIVFSPSFSNPRPEAWRLDGVTVAEAAPSAAPERSEFRIADSTTKLYPVLVKNPGTVPKSIRAAVDPRQSQLTTAQLAGITLDPAQLVVGPGETGVTMVRVATPTDRAAFADELRAVISITEAGAPFSPAISVLNLSFDPRLRPDLSVGALLNGRAVAPGASMEVEAGIPHDITVAIRNDGLAESRPAAARLIVRNATTIFMEANASVEALPPFSSSRHSTVASWRWTPPLALRGSMEMIVEVDPESLNIDYDLRNNAARWTAEVVPLMRPDLEVTERSLGVTSVDGRPMHEGVPGQLARIEAVVRNSGLAPAREVVVRLLADGSVLREDTVPVLGAGATYGFVTNHFLPSTTVVYRLQVVTGDLEASNLNNEASREVPVLPDGVGLSAPARVPATPGIVERMSVNISNRGIRPLLLNLSLEGSAARFAGLEPRALTLAPGETQRLVVSLAPAESEPPSPHRLVVVVKEDDDRVAQKTVDVTVEVARRLEAVPFPIRGAPHDLLVQAEIANRGNVPSHPTVRVLGPGGAVLSEGALDPIPPGGRTLAKLKVSLPPDTPPGPLPITLVVLDSATGDEEPLVSKRVEAAIAPGGRAIATVASTHDNGAQRTFNLSLRYEGNVPGARVPIPLSVPDGLRVAFSETVLQVAPGQQATFAATVDAVGNATPGRHRILVGFTDPAAPPDPSVILASVIALDYEVKAPRLDLVTEVGDREILAGPEPTVTMRVENLGTAASPPRAVLLYVDGVLTSREPVPPLAPGESKEVKLRVVGDAGLRHLVVTLEPIAADPTPQGVALTAELQEGAGAKVVHSARKVVPGVGFPALAVLAALALLRGGGRRRA